MTDIVEALADCLETLRTRKGEISACLDRYPELAHELAPLLRIVEQIRPLPADVTPPPELKRVVRAGLSAGEAQAGGAPHCQKLGNRQE